MARALPGCRRRQAAQPFELRGTDRAVLPEERALPPRARVETHDHDARVLEDALPRAARLELEPRARGELLPPRELARLGRPRARAAGDREAIEVVVAGDDEQAPPLVPLAERRRHELPAVPVVGAVAREHHRVDRVCIDHPRGAQAAQVGVVRGRLEHRRQRPLAGRRTRQRDRAASLEAARLGRCALDRIEEPAALASARDAVRIALGVDEDDLSPFSWRSRRTRHDAFFPARREAQLARVGNACAPLDEPRSVVQRVAEPGHVQIGDVSEREHSACRLTRADHIPATILNVSPSRTRSRRLSATAWCHSSVLAPGSFQAAAYV